MAKPFALPETGPGGTPGSHQPGSGSGTASGAGPPPPAGAGSGGGGGGGSHNATSQNQNIPNAPSSAARVSGPIFSFPPPTTGGSGGSLPSSAPIPVANGNHHAYQQLLHQQHQQHLHQQHHQLHQQQQPQQQQQQQQHYPYVQQHQSYPGAGFHHPPVPSGGISVGSAPQEPHPMLQMTPPASGMATAVQTPQLGPVNGDHLMQVLCEALYRYRMADAPPTPLSQSPPSASCSPFTTNGGNGYHGGQVFFPRTPAPTTGGRNGRSFFHQSPNSGGGTQQQQQQHQQQQQQQQQTQQQQSTTGSGGTAPSIASNSNSNTHSQPTPVSASSHSSSSGISSSGQTPSCSSGTPHHCGQYQQIQFNWHDEGDSSESEGSSSGATSSSSSGCSPHCLGLDGGPCVDGGGGGRSSGTTLVNSSGSSSASTLYGGVPPHLDYMAGREQLQEFPGKIPQRKRKSRTPKPKKPPFMDKPLVWQVAVTAALIVLGCSYLAAR
ncbi:DNA N6-methyl adenine demethylase-like isoform X2 [Anopheles darlingi]|uniref:DNA N6-methyl adenine demethylase-like isoform X2 n=1 Tax=Anopheles darlingi TaxID=43151 RepID=UPI0021001E20|nr:DNA N6-methyl adenine demethylase-like isoform X2 [Anopheles darlingi]